MKQKEAKKGTATQNRDNIIFSIEQEKKHKNQEEGKK